LREKDFVAKIDAGAFADVREEARRWRVRETGGILIGYWADETQAVITHASGPGPNAKHGLYTFEPDSSYAQRHLNKIYRESGGRFSYIGDWHTHPLGSLVPSESDSATTFGVAADPAYRAPRPVLLLFRYKLFSTSCEARALVYLLEEASHLDAQIVVEAVS
jgi:integrative and conjugative element protein (TIGR02256 family)